MTTRRIAFPAILALAGVACTVTPLEAQRGSLETRALITRRFVADSFWTRTWYRGATKDPDLFTEPREVIVAGDLVVVLDMGLREVSAFDARSGATRLQLAARGEGPGEFKRPAHLVAVRDGFAVLDHVTSRLSAFDTRGRFTWDTPIANAGGAEGLCVRRDGRVVTKMPGATNAIVTFDSTGRTVSRQSLPWPDGGIRTAGLSAFVAGPDGNGNCVLARRFGSEWLVVGAAGTLVRRPYVSRHPEARVDVRTGARKRFGNEGTFTRTEYTSSDAGTSGVMTIGDTMIVRGGPAEPDGYRLLDYHLLPSGRYLHSRRLPSVFIATAVGTDGTFYGTTIGEESGALVAFRPTTTRQMARPTPRAAPGDSTSAQPARRSQPGGS